MHDECLPLVIHNWVVSYDLIHGLLADYTAATSVRQIELVALYGGSTIRQPSALACLMLCPRLEKLMPVSHSLRDARAEFCAMKSEVVDPRARTLNARERASKRLAVRQGRAFSSVEHLTRRSDGCPMIVSQVDMQRSFI